MTKDEIIEMARQAGVDMSLGEHWSFFIEELEAFAKLVAEKAIKEALAQEQEPVGQLLEDAFGRGQVMWFNESMLYTTPPQRTWVGLTDDEMYRYCPIWLGQADFKALMLHIEAKLKDKNTRGEE